MNESLKSWIADGGPFMWPLLLASVVLPLTGLVMLLVTLVRKKGALTFGIVLLALVGASFVVGAAGSAREERLALQDFSEREPADQTPTVRTVLTTMAPLHLRSTAFGGAVLPTLVAFALIGLGISRRDRPEGRPAPERRQIAQHSLET